MSFRIRPPKASHHWTGSICCAVLRYLSATLAVWVILATGSPFQPGAADRDSWMQSATAACQAPQGCGPEDEPVLKGTVRQSGKAGSSMGSEDASLFVSASQVLRAQAEGRPVTLLDVRSTQDFNTFRIPGSLSVPFSAVWTKGFLRSRRVVLVHSGFRCELLVKACRGLRAAGFDVAILAGGLPQWRRSGGHLEGDAVAIQDVDKIGPNTFYEAQHDGTWIVIGTSSNTGLERTLLPQLRVLPAAADPAALPTELAKIIGNDTSNPCLRVLLVSEHGEYPENLLRAVDQIPAVNVFRLTGGLAAYRDYLNLQKSMQQHKPDQPSKWRRCFSCP